MLAQVGQAVIRPYIDLWAIIKPLLGGMPEGLIIARWDWRWLTRRLRHDTTEGRRSRASAEAQMTV